MNYRGYTIALATRSGGKAGRLRNKTSTVQVREPFPNGDYLLLKQLRFNVNDHASQAKALQKAREFIDRLEVAREKAVKCPDSDRAK